MAHIAGHTNSTFEGGYLQSDVPGILTFPPELGATQGLSNYMGFEPFRIVGGFGSQRDRQQDYESASDPIFLPVPTGIGTNYTQGWNQENVGATSSAIGSAASGAQIDQMGTMSDMGGTSTGVVGQTNLQNIVRNAAAGKATEGVGWGSISNFVQSLAPSKEDAFKGLGVAATGLIGDAVGQPLMQGLTGTATMSESMVTFSGPSYREFTFPFSLKASSRDERDVIQRIIRRFKGASAAEQIASTGYRIYALPFVFEIKYYFKSGENQFMNRIGMCALTNLGINYGGDRFSTFDDGMPVQIDLSLAFKEIELLDKQRVLAGY